MYRTIFYVRHRAFSGIQLYMLAKDHHSSAWWQLMFPHRGEDREGHRVRSWVSSHSFQALVSNSALNEHGARETGWQCLENGLLLWSYGGSPHQDLVQIFQCSLFKGTHSPAHHSSPIALGGSLINSSVLQSEFGGLIPRFVVRTLQRGSRHCLHRPQERKFSNTWSNSHVEEFEYGSMRETNKDFFIILKTRVICVKGIYFGFLSRIT